MTEAPTPVVIPPELRPADGRFGSGPSKVRSEALVDLAAAAPGLLGTSHRQTPVRDLVRRVREGVSALLELPDGYEVVLGNGGTTAFWDAAAFCLVRALSQHVVCGEFSAKFASVIEACPHLESPLLVEAAPGERPVLSGDADADTIALIQNETSTGVQMDVVRPEGAHESALVLVDATSAAGGLRVEASEFDVYYFAPQKCLASEGGLWLAALSPPALERIAAMTATRAVPASLDLSIALENSRKDQTYNTPAIATLFLTAHTLDWINDHGGLAWAAARCDTSADVVYRWAEKAPFATPFVKESRARSHTVATIDFDTSVDASAIAAVLRANGIVDVEPYRKLGRNQLRIALYPAIDPADVEVLTRAIDFVVAEIE
ncbi:MAG: phosphoserine transaminase [Acidimicrobiia bacterium]|nr:phosphoserine transaminase [Acidimicrobiia bacterium]